MKKKITLYIESDSDSLISSLNNSFKKYADLQQVEVSIEAYKDSAHSVNEDDKLNVYILNNAESIEKFNRNIQLSKDLYTLVEINSNINHAYEFLNDKAWDTSIVDFVMIGGQRQFFNQLHYDYLNERYYDFMHLGDVRKEISDIEPYLRDAHVMRMSFNALRFSDFPAKHDSNPSGFFAEDFIAIARYAGLSPKLDHILFFDLNSSILEDSSACQELLCQLLWYMAEGYGFRMKEEYDDENHEHFVFEIKDPELQVEFIHSSRSSRWWYSFKDSEGVAHTFSCNYTDFESMQNMIVSPRIKSAILRYL